MLSYATNIIETARTRYLEQSKEQNRQRVIWNINFDEDEITVQMEDGEEIFIPTESFCEYYNDITRDSKPPISPEVIGVGFHHEEVRLYLKFELGYPRVVFSD